jgi:ribosomal protein L16 Arg81 hydroxylase
MAIHELLGDTSAEEFLKEYFLRLPYTRAGGCESLLPLGNWETVDRLLQQPGVDVLAGRQGTAWLGENPTSAAEARQLLIEGYTLGIRHAERQDERLAALAGEIRHEFAAEVNIHLYCTPGGQQGFGWHYDAEDVFILQTVGSKAWSLRKNTVNPWPLVETIPANMRYERELMPLLRCDLRAGDWLYIPAGYWHRTEAGEESISLSIGLMSVTALDAFDFLRQKLLDSLRWRQRLPTAGSVSTGSDADLIDQYREIFADLASDLARQFSGDLAKEFLAARRAAHGADELERPVESP